jgi:hypothetical protein
VHLEGPVVGHFWAGGGWGGVTAWAWVEWTRKMSDGRKNKNSVFLPHFTSLFFSFYTHEY